MPVDVLIINALDDELQAVLQLRDDSPSAWDRNSDPSAFPYYLRNFALPGGDQMSLAAAWSGAMGETAAVNRARMLIEFLEPHALAMSGICAGRKGDVFLGDVIVADRVFSYDHGKLVASNESGHRVEQIFHDIETYNLERAWAMNVPDFARDWHEVWHNERPLSLDSQRRWLLHSLYAHEHDKAAPAPRSHPDRTMRCPNWTGALQSLRKRKHVTLKGDTLALTKEGKKLVLEERELYVDGSPSDPPFRVHLGPIATGKTVRQDPDLFSWLARFSRKVLGVEMEAAAIGLAGEFSGIPSIIAKAVSDYGDTDKDDGFRTFACRASAEFLLRFLSRYPPRSLNQNRVLTAIQASGHRLGPLPYVSPGAEPQPLLDSEKNNVLDLDTPAGRSKERANLYREMHDMVLVHILTPSNNPGQKYDVFIYAKRRKDADISDVRSAEFFFGSHWGNQIFPGTRDGNRIGVRTAAFGPFLCTCRITFTNGNKITLHRYIDFEMGDVVAKLAESDVGSIRVSQSDLLDISFLARGLECARSVVRLTVHYDELRTHATGFFIAPGRLLTAHHVLFGQNGQIPSTIEITPNYERDMTGLIWPPIALSGRPETIVGDREDDWAVVDIEPSSDISPIPLDSPNDSIAVGDQVYIVQHPFGGPKKISLVLNTVTHVDDRTIRYLTTSTVGSSGAPVFNAKWQIVALHHAARSGPSGGSQLLSEGIRIQRIATALRKKGLLP